MKRPPGGRHLRAVPRLLRRAARDRPRRPGGRGDRLPGALPAGAAAQRGCDPHRGGVRSHRRVVPQRAFRRLQDRRGDRARALGAVRTGGGDGDGRWSLVVWPMVEFDGRCAGHRRGALRAVSRLLRTRRPPEARPPPRVPGRPREKSVLPKRPTGSSWAGIPPALALGRPRPAQRGIPGDGSGRPTSAAWRRTFDHTVESFRNELFDGYKTAPEGCTHRSLPMERSGHPAVRVGQALYFEDDCDAFLRGGREFSGKRLVVWPMVESGARKRRCRRPVRAQPPRRSTASCTSSEGVPTSTATVNCRQSRSTTRPPTPGQAARRCRSGGASR